MAAEVGLAKIGPNDPGLPVCAGAQTMRGAKISMLDECTSADIDRALTVVTYELTVDDSGEEFGVGYPVMPA